MKPQQFEVYSSESSHLSGQPQLQTTHRFIEALHFQATQVTWECCEWQGNVKGENVAMILSFPLLVFTPALQCRDIASYCIYHVYTHAITRIFFSHNFYSCIPVQAHVGSDRIAGKRWRSGKSVPWTPIEVRISHDLLPLTLSSWDAFEYAAPARGKKITQNLCNICVCTIV